MMENIEAVAYDVLKTYPIKRAAFFGSAARGDMTEDSDIDMIVEFEPDAEVGLGFYGLIEDLKEAYGRNVDLITFEALEDDSKPRYKRFNDRVKKDMRIFYEPE